MGAVISLEVADEEDSSLVELPWLVTFEPDEDEAAQQWDSFTCGPYLHDHALAIAEAVAFAQEGVIAVVSPALPALTPDEITGMIEQRRAEADEALDDDLDDLEDLDDDFEGEFEDEDDDLTDELDDSADADDAELADAELLDADADAEDDFDADEDEFDVVEVDTDEIEVPAPEDIRAGIETVMRQLLARTGAPVTEPA